MAIMLKRQIVLSKFKNRSLYFSKVCESTLTFGCLIVLSYGMGYIRPRHPGPRVGSCRIRVLGSGLVGSGSFGS